MERVYTFQFFNKILTSITQKLKPHLINPKKFNNLHITLIILKLRLAHKLAQIISKPIQLSLPIQSIPINKPYCIEHQDIHVTSHEGTIW